MMIDRVDAVILAGGGEIEPGTGVKGMLTIGSRMMVEYVIEALYNSRYIDQIVVVGPGGNEGELYGAGIALRSAG